MLSECVIIYTESNERGVMEMTTNKQQKYENILNNKQFSQTQQLAISGLMAAVICVATFAVRVPTAIGYIHIGDGFIFLAVALLGYYGVAAAAIGSGLADLIAGAPLYIPGTFIIKGLMALVALKYINNHYTVGRCIVAYLLAEILMVLGYFLYEIPLYGMKAAAGSMFFNDIQGLVGIIIGTVVVMTIKQKFSSTKKHLEKEDAEKAQHSN